MEGTILTLAGQAELLNAPILKEKVNWSTIVLGDANGTIYIPEETQTELRNQVWSGDISNIEIISEGRLDFHTVIPANVGPFDIREAGILNEKGVLVAVAPVDNQHKSAISGGMGTINDMEFILGIDLENASSVNIVVDPTVIVASRAYVEDYTQKKITELKSELYECTEEDIVEAMGRTWSGETGTQDYRVATSEEVRNAFKQGLSS